MLNKLPTDNHEILLIAHTSDYGCRFILNYLQNVKPIVKRNRFLQIKATCYNPIRKKKIALNIKDSYKSISMPLREFGDCFWLDVSKEAMPYNIYIYIYIYTYENVNLGACRIQDATDVLKQ